MREQIIKIRLTEREAEQIRAEAESLGLSPATWLRMIARLELRRVANGQ